MATVWCARCVYERGLEDEPKTPWRRLGKALVYVGGTSFCEVHLIVLKDKILRDTGVVD